MGEVIPFPGGQQKINQETIDLYQQQIELAATAIAECGFNNQITRDALSALSEDQVAKAIELSEYFKLPPEAS